MARIVGGITTSHIPAIGKAILQGLESEPYWKPFFDGYGPVRAWLDEVKPDVAVIIYNDHGLNFFLDKLPTFAIGAAAQYCNGDEGWGLPVAAPFPGDPEFSWHLIESLIADEFDLTTCQEMMVDHGFTVPMALLWPGHDARPVKTVPISINTVQFPYPTPARCYKFGKAIGRAIESFEREIRAVVVGTGGMSHQLDGERAGFINREFDLTAMDMLVQSPQALARYSTTDLVRLCGAQGVELLTWLTMRGALNEHVVEMHRNYHVPISNTAGATMLLANVNAATCA